MLKKLLIVLSICFFVVNTASATFIRLDGDSSFTVETEAGASHFVFSGNYKISNRGDETAFSVYPSFRLGTWRWTGDEKSIKAGEGAEWKFEAEVSVQSLVPEQDKEFLLPIKGRHPVFVKRHYQDSRRYDFSAVEITGILIEELTEEQNKLVEDPSVKLQTSLDEGSEIIEGKAVLLNYSEKEIPVRVSYFGADELSVFSDLRSVILKKMSSEEIGFSVKNLQGVSGSSYPVYVLAEWEESGVRNFSASWVMLDIGKNTTYGLSTCLLSALILAFTLIIIIFQIRKRRTNNPSEDPA